MLLRTHVLIDLSRSKLDPSGIQDFLTALGAPDSLLGVVGQVTVLFPAGNELGGYRSPESWRIVAPANPISEANRALLWAGDNDCNLLVLFGPTYLGSEVLALLVEAFEFDPHFGVSIPRQTDAKTGALRKLVDRLGDQDLNFLPRRVLTEIDHFYVAPEMLQPCMLVRNVLVANLPGLDESCESVVGAFQLYFSKVRRTGFRTVIVNRALITLPDVANPSLTIPKSDIRKLHSIYPDAGIAKAELLNASLHTHESLLGRLFSSTPGIRKSILLDISGVRNFVNGTSEAVLALCDSIQGIKSDWNFSLLADPAAVSYHHLDNRYANWNILTNEIKRHFTVALRCSQPWQLSTMVELHRAALFNFFAMLDTISWDILLDAPVGLGATWDFMCQYSDGLLYNSHYTQGHMFARFPLARRAPSYVFQHSFNPHDYVRDTSPIVNKAEDYIFVIGNNYDHKHLGPTLDLLISAFPFQNFKVLGFKEYQHPRVEALESGKVPDSEIDALFSKSRLIVFPSFYEGFGLPVLKGLSYGRTVIARRSSLLLELASNYRGPGTLLDFATPAELVEAVGSTIHQKVKRSVSLGTALQQNEEPKSWTDIARGVLDFIESRLSCTSDLQWLARERAIRQLTAFSA